MKKIIRLALLFTAIAVGNHMQASDMMRPAQPGREIPHLVVDERPAVMRLTSDDISLLASDAIEKTIEKAISDAIDVTTFTNNDNQTGQFWPNKTGNRLGRAKINNQGYEAVKPIARGSIGPAYDTTQQTAIKSMGLNIKDAVVIGELSSASVASVKAKLNANLQSLRYDSISDMKGQYMDFIEDMQNFDDEKAAQDTALLFAKIEILEAKISNFTGIQLLGIPSVRIVPRR